MEEDKILKATHFGILKIGEKELNCAVLEDGSRILLRKAVFGAFGRPERGNIKAGSRVPNMPSFIDANNLQPFISKDLIDLINLPVKYVSKTGKIMDGFKAEILPLLCDVYLNARDAGTLTKGQMPLSCASEILVRSLAKVGIIALVDEATGYQHERARDELQQILKAYISAELLPWTKRFPDEFYQHLFRLLKWQYNPLSVKRPGYVGTLTMELVYNQLPPGVADELKKITPKSVSGNYTKRFHQSLSLDIGNEHLKKQLYEVIALMKISPNWRTFKTYFNKAFGGQLEMDEVMELDN
ncbi:MAG: P63C domain-containing protein [Candidatus Omnitrophota bacterium]